jgi:hypothetical protein
VQAAARFRPPRYLLISFAFSGKHLKWRLSSPAFSAQPADLAGPQPAAFAISEHLYWYFSSSEGYHPLRHYFPIIIA